jgi:putative membrane protein insertion efficiency factor
MKNIEHGTSNIERPMAARCVRDWMLDVGCWMLDVPRFNLIFLIRVYRLTISPAQVFLFGATGGCRFTPTCSQYAIEALQTRGALAGSALAAKRICRCHPWGGCGHDPVQKAENQFASEHSI